jgi:hypothetical protein
VTILEFGENPGGLCARFSGLFGFRIIFELKKLWTGLTGLWTGGVSVHRGPGSTASGRARRRWARRGAGACCESLGRERETARISPRSELGDVVVELCQLQRGLAAVVGA